MKNTASIVIGFYGVLLLLLVAMPQLFLWCFGLNGSIDLDPFAPSVIDLSGCSTGAYSVKVSNDKESVSTTIINIHND